MLTMTLFGITACSGDDGPPGPPGSGEAGPPGEEGPPGGPEGSASISGIVPPVVYLDRTEVEVSVSGFGTTWDTNNLDETKLDFGEGITVTDVFVASPTSLVARITIDQDAPTTGRDVVIDGLPYVGAFNVVSPLEITAVGGKTMVPQGAPVRMVAKQLDLSTPFQPMSQFAPGNAVVTAFGSSAHRVQEVSLYGMAFDLLIDVNVATGGSVLEIESGPLGRADIRSYSPTAEVMVEARTPTPFSTSPHVVTVSEPRQSELLSKTFTDSLVQVALTFDETLAPDDVNPELFVLPASGKFEDALQPSFFFGGPGPGSPTTTFLAVGSATHYLVSWDGSGEVDYDYQLELTEIGFSGVTPLTKGVPIAGAVATGEIAVYSYAATAMEEVVLTMSDGATSSCLPPGPPQPNGIYPSIRLFSPSGSLYFELDFGECPVDFFGFAEETGTYHLVIAESGQCAAQQIPCPFDFTFEVNAP